MKKVDCSFFINYINEKNRLTKYCSINCCECGLDILNNGTSMNCKQLERERPYDAVAIIQKWSDKCPIEKTILDDFLQKNPNEKLNEYGIPDFCLEEAGYKRRKACHKNFTMHYNNINCIFCWHRALIEGEK